MVFEHRGEYASQWAAISSVAEKFGMTAETLRSWVRQAEIDDGARVGTTTAEAQCVKARAREP
jgi:transposase-like protein